MGTFYYKTGKQFKKKTVLSCPSQGTRFYNCAFPATHRRIYVAGNDIVVVSEKALTTWIKFCIKIIFCFIRLFIYVYFIYLC